MKAKLTSEYMLSSVFNDGDVIGNNEGGKDVVKST